MSQRVRFLRCTRVRRGVSLHLVLLALVSSAVLLSGVPVGAAESDIDLSFNGQGFVVTNHDEVDQVDDIVIQPDGKIVAVGHTGFIRESDGAFLRLMVARYNTDGSLDPYFGNGGIVITDVGPSMKGMSVALQADGKIVVASGSDANFVGPRIALVRYNTDGSLDNTFGFGGIALESIRRPVRIKDLAIRSDGKFLVTGEGRSEDRRSETFVAILVLFEEFGFLDFTFGDIGVLQVVPTGSTAPLMVTANDLALQTDDKIVVAGVCQRDSAPSFCLSRHNSDGSLDNTFHGNGVVVTHFDSFSAGGAAKSVRIQPDGKIVAAGETVIDPIGSVPALARFNTDGFLDSSFGSNGNGTEVSFENANLRLESLALKPSGKIVIVGEAVNPPFVPIRSAMATAFYSADGIRQDVLTTPIGERSAATAVAVEPDGRVVVGGCGNFSTEGGFTLGDFALVRYGPNDPPIVSITGPPSGSLIAVNTPVDFFGTVIDDSGPPVVEWSFESTAGTVVVPASWNFGFIHTTHTFSEAGVYKVSLKASDGLLSSNADMLVVVYDPNGGWVAGGGWIHSPEGAYVLNPTLSGKANFGFVSKYENGANTPTGNAQFHFNAGDLKFQSTSYEWLVIAGGKKAQYKGAGTINGGGIYHFMLTAIDGDQPGGGGQDKFRIKIWSDSDKVIYDNHLNAPDGDDPATVVGGGSIVIHH